MKLVSNKQIYFRDQHVITVDAIICSSGYESRCTSFITSNNVNSNLKFVFSFKNHKNYAQRKANDIFFKEKNFEFIELGNNNFAEIDAVLKRINEIDKNEIVVLIDYSSMTSIWYASILNYYRNAQISKKIVLLFCYSYAVFTPPIASQINNKEVNPIFGYSTLSIPDKPTALIIGLGYENDKAFGLSEYLDAETYIFYTEREDNNKEYTEEVEKYNRDLLSITKKENIIKYPLFDLNLSQNILYQMCSDLRDFYRLVLAPCGPKPFTLLSLIMSIKFRDIDVWRISSDQSDAIYERKSNNKFSIFECCFE